MSSKYAQWAQIAFNWKFLLVLVKWLYFLYPLIYMVVFGIFGKGIPTSFHRTLSQVSMSTGSDVIQH